MNRRTLLGVLVACSMYGLSNDLGAAENTAWGYSGGIAPDKWSTLSDDYAICSSGRRQSPVDLVEPIRANIEIARPLWRPVEKARVENNGHTIDVHMPEGLNTLFEDRTFTLLQVHFHATSEHTIAGHHYPMEAHFVHRADDGDLLVLGVFIDYGEKNTVLEKVWNVMPKSAGEEVVLDSFTPQMLLPGDSGHFRYSGSLTTPPCTENVSWVVYSKPISASSDQIAAFKDVFGKNNRPTQGLNRRLILQRP